MIICRTVDELRQATSRLPRDLALVPTMGALHEGHLTLVREAAKLAPTVGVSIFVNPTQFGPNEDFARYPRQEEKDIAMAEAAGAHIAFCPTADEMYGDSSTTVHVADVSEGFEGAIRPGHFDGVATIVCKLFNVFQPDFSVFGWKDLQQCAVIRKMIADLKINTKLHLVETIREEGGLALSSRNQYLSEGARRHAQMIHRTLQEAATQLRESDIHTSRIVAQAKDVLTTHGFEVDYFELVNFNTMKIVTNISDQTRLTTAVRLESVRLLDNIPI